MSDIAVPGLLDRAIRRITTVWRDMAAGVEDTLKACLARIPKDGSSGQRMLAKQSCKQDEGTRKASQDAPKF